MQNVQTKFNYLGLGPTDYRNRSQKLQNYFIFFNFIQLEIALSCGVILDVESERNKYYA
jgi:hypothetical protein